MNLLMVILPNMLLRLKILGNLSILVSSPTLESIQPIGKIPLLFKFFWPNAFPFGFRWVFEKYDGIRGFWNPLKKAMFSRTGKRFDLPQEVIDDMPSDLFLDGELWYCILRHSFSYSSSLLLGLGGTTFKNQ